MSNNNHQIEEREHKDYLEGLKLHYDQLKHLTTLSTGALLLLVAMLEKIFKNPEWKPLILVAFIGFFISIIFSLSSMRVFALHISRSGKVDEKRVNFLTMSYSVSSIGFFTAVLSVLIFSIVNFNK